MKHRVTEVLVVDTETERWECGRCGYDIGPVSEPYKHGLMLAARDPSEVWQPLIDAPYTFAYDRDWARIVEAYCPRCATLFEVELLPPGHPVTDDIRVDVGALRAREREAADARAASGEPPEPTR